jgi:hypothetical protein
LWLGTSSATAQQFIRDGGLTAPNNDASLRRAALDTVRPRRSDRHPSRVRRDDRQRRPRTKPQPPDNQPK